MSTRWSGGSERDFFPSVTRDVMSNCVTFCGLLGHQVVRSPSELTSVADCDAIFLIQSPFCTVSTLFVSFDHSSTTHHDMVASMRAGPVLSAPIPLSDGLHQRYASVTRHFKQHPLNWNEYKDLAVQR